jgi:hypothetical protein
MCPHTAIYVAWSQAKNQVITETEGLLDKDTGEAGSFYRTCLNEQVNKRDLRMPANRPANACNETYECLERDPLMPVKRPTNACNACKETY